MVAKRNKILMSLAGIALLIGISGNVLAGEYGGSWLLKDTNGTPFEITLSKDGTADGTHGDAMKHGKWAEADGSAVIHWNTGWITRIAKQGDKYVKTAFKPGTSLSDTPTNTSDAIRKE